MSEGPHAPGPEEVGLDDAPSLLGADSFRIALPKFEGPLDLLLHLIREHKLDIFDIPIALVTQKYLEHLARMKEINLDIAGEFLVMASTLAHIKSRLLLPRQEIQGEQILEPEEQGDPRAELVRRLLEYQKYKEAAETLGRQDIFGRDVFARSVPAQAVPIPDDEVGFVEISVYKLIEALDRVLERLNPRLQHEIFRERLSLSDAMRRVADKLRGVPETSFFALFESSRTRSEVVVTFLALLEMCKRRLIRIFQPEGARDILISAAGDALSNLGTPEVDESEYR